MMDGTVVMAAWKGIPDPGLMPPVNAVERKKTTKDVRPRGDIRVKPTSFIYPLQRRDFTTNRSFQARLTGFCGMLTD